MDDLNEIKPSGPGFEDCDILARALQKVQHQAPAPPKPAPVNNERRQSSYSGVETPPARKESVGVTSVTRAVPVRQSSSFEPVPPPDENFEQRKNTIASGPPPSDREFAWPRPITEGEARETLAREVRKHSCWREHAVRAMNITNIECYTSLHYTLETFSESRSTSEAMEPYSAGQQVDCFEADINPWDIPCAPGADFVEESRVMEMPGSSSLALCGSCHGEGISHCFHCRGFGTDKCQGCRGTGMKAGIPHPAVYTHPMVGQFPHGDANRGYPGHSAAVMRSQGLSYGMGTPVHFMNVAGGMPPPGLGTHDLCYFCHGRGISECSHCRGHGKRACAACSGSGHVRCFSRLKIKFAVERSELFHHDGGVPEKLLQNVTGEVVMAECQAFVLPLRNYPVVEMNEQSKRLCQIHLHKCLGLCKILQQRHVLEAVPVAKVDFELGRKQGTFWVYGQERMCFIPKYPSKCTLL